MSEELKPCPFCGGEGVLYDYRKSPFVECGKCGAGGKIAISREGAIAAWNHRQSVTTEAMAAMEQAREALELFARLELPKRSDGNAGFYSIPFARIDTARQALATLTEQIERMRGEAQQPSGAMTGE